MTKLEDFCREVAQELGISLHKACEANRISEGGEAEKITVSYEKKSESGNIPFTEHFFIKEKNDKCAEITLGRYVGRLCDCGTTLHLCLPAENFRQYLARLDMVMPLSQKFCKGFEQRHKEENSQKLNEFAFIQDFDGVKELVYRLLNIGASA
jgi:hypothetical protein